jgi:hypothetical protein
MLFFVAIRSVKGLLARHQILLVNGCQVSFQGSVSGLMHS